MARMHVSLSNNKFKQWATKMYRVLSAGLTGCCEKKQNGREKQDVMENQAAMEIPAVIGSQMSMSNR